MRILKEYSALINPVMLSELTDVNSRQFELTLENYEKVAAYVAKRTEHTDICNKTLISLKVSASDIFMILTENAAEGEMARVSCTYHGYYFMLVFEFSESALPLHTLNKSIRILNTGKETEVAEVGFMDLVHLVNRIELSVDKASGKMRITIIKEKRYTVPALNNELPKLTGSLSLCSKHAAAEDFSARVYAHFKKHGKNAEKYLISPKLFSDNLESYELEAVFLRDEAGNCGGGAVWQKSYGIIALMIFITFDESEEGINLLLNEFKSKIKASDVNFIVSLKQNSEMIADYFDMSDEKYYYKAVTEQKKHTSYIKPDLMPLIKKAYKNLEINREIKQINYNYTFTEPYSVLKAKVDAEASEAVLSVMWFGDDLKANIIRHVVALRRIGIDNIYFRLDLGVYEEMAVSDLVQECGFEVKYLWPYSSKGGDIIVFEYCENMVYEMKPCVISPINKLNIDKTPELVRKVYGDNYPSQYLYHPKQLWEKIRKRSVYPYIAIDDDGQAVGLISFARFGINPYLYEIGQLMVDPVHRGTNVVIQLIEYVYTTAIPNMDFDAVLSESVTNHKLSQRSCVNSGFIDTALKLNIMSADAFALEDERRQVKRMSCVVSCIERADEVFTVYLPVMYVEQIKLCFEGLKPRIYESVSREPDTNSITEHLIDDSEVNTSRMVNATIVSIGEDIEAAVEKLDNYAKNKEIKCLMINIPLNNASISRAVKALKTHGFFFGGVMPYWYPEGDALLMQKLYGNMPDWDSIKLFSRKIKKIAEYVKKDMEK